MSPTERSVEETHREGENHGGEPWRQTSRSRRGATERKIIADFVATERVRITEESHGDRRRDLSRSNRERERIADFIATERKSFRERERERKDETKKKQTSPLSSQTPTRVNRSRLFFSQIKTRF